MFPFKLSGRNSMVECQLPKLKVASSILVARSNIYPELKDMHINKRLLVLAVFCLSSPAFTERSVAQKKHQAKPRPAQTATALVDRWDAMLKDEKFDAVVAETSKSIERNPGMALAFRFRGRAYHELEKYDLADRDAEEVVRSISKPRTAREFEAVCGAKATLYKPWTEVIADCGAALKLNPRLSGALLLRANAYSRNKQYDLAIKDYTTALSADPKNATAYSGRAFTYRLEKQTKAALIDINKAIELKPEKADYYHTRALIYGQINESEKAIADYTKAIELLPSFYFAYLNRASHYLENKDNDRALFDYTKAIDTWGGKVFTEPYLRRAKIYAARGEKEKAVADLTRALEIDPRAVDLLVERGLSYFKSEQIDAAIIDFTKAIEVDRSAADALLLRGSSYYKKKVYDLALSDISKAIEYEPKSSTAYNLRGNVYYSKKEYDLAIVDYTTALTLNPEREHFYLRQRAGAYEAKGDKTRADEDRKRADDVAKKWACAYNPTDLATPRPGLVGANLLNTTSVAIKVFIDGALQCETGADGNCSFAVIPGRHFIVVQRAGSADLAMRFDTPRPPNRLSIVFGASGLTTVDCGSATTRNP